MGATLWAAGQPPTVSMPGTPCLQQSSRFTPMVLKFLMQVTNAVRGRIPFKTTTWLGDGVVEGSTRCHGIGLVQHPATLDHKPLIVSQIHFDGFNIHCVQGKREREQTRAGEVVALR